MQHNQHLTPLNGHHEGPDEAVSEQDAEVSIEGRHYVLATDGACKGNPGTGGWGVVIQLREGPTVLRQRCLAGQELFTTNNRMELMGPIRGLAGLKEAIPTVVISDSEYVVLGMRGRLEQWKAKGWRNSGGSVKNRDLWEELDALQQERSSLEWQWVKGHALHDLNETADRLASNAARGAYLAGDKAIRKEHPTWFK